MSTLRPGLVFGLSCTNPPITWRLARVTSPVTFGNGFIAAIWGFTFQKNMRTDKTACKSVGRFIVVSRSPLPHLLPLTLLSSRWTTVKFMCQRLPKGVKWSCRSGQRWRDFTPSTALEPLNAEAARSELQSVLHSSIFIRSPSLAHLLAYLCEKAFLGEASQIKEYSVAIDVFGRQPSFDQNSDSIVRVQANRLRKRLAEYYNSEGASHTIHITIPIGQYVPVFEEQHLSSTHLLASVPRCPEQPSEWQGRRFSTKSWPWIALLILAIPILFVRRNQDKLANPPATSAPFSFPSERAYPVGQEIRILAGSSRNYVDRSGKMWSADSNYIGGSPFRSSVQHIWRTQDPVIYRGSRQGDFEYAIPLKKAIYELHLHFAETYYGPEDVGGGGEGSRIMNVALNGVVILSDFDVIADCGEARTADVKVFTDVVPAGDGFLHLSFSSLKGGRAMVSAIELLPGHRRQIRPVRIVPRDVPYYSNASQWWSSDIYFRGGQLAASEEAATDTDDPELYETERWGRFSYAIPVTPGKYTVTLHFVGRAHGWVDEGNISEVPVTRNKSGGGRVFNVFCNGRTMLSNLDVANEVGNGHLLVGKIRGVEPNAQGKILLEFVPLRHYASINAIEVIPE